MSIEEVKQYWNNRPCNIRHSNKPVGTKEFFEEVSLRKYKVEPHILEFADFKKWDGKKVLEVSCGIGTAANSFVENGAIYKGIDISKKSIELAKKRFEVFNLKGEIEYGNIENYTSEEQYDLIYSFGVLHHTPDIMNQLKIYINY